MHKTMFNENEKIDKANGSKTLVLLGYYFSVQSAFDHVASIESLKLTPCRVVYKSLIIFSSGDVVVAFGPISVEFTVMYASVDPRTPPRTHGKLKFCSIFIGHSDSPMPIIESEMHLISADDAKLNKYPNLPPFSDFGKYARNRIGTLILQANADFEKKASRIKFKKETLSVAMNWILETPEPSAHKYAFCHTYIIYPIIRLFIYSFVIFFIYSFIHLFIYSFICLFLYLMMMIIYLFIYSFNYLFIYSLNCLFVYLMMKKKMVMVMLLFYIFVVILNI